MKYIFNQSSIISILENIEDIKYIRQYGKLYKFFINNGTLMLNIYEENSQYLYETHVIEKNVKSDFDVYTDDANQIHLSVINKKYNLIYIYFDGITWVKEEIYHFVAAVGIPSTPVIKVYDSTIHIILSFLKVSGDRMWLLRSYMRENGSWDFNVIDRGLGLCYSQPTFYIGKCGDIYLIYRYFQGNSNLKYSSFDYNKKEWKKAQVIFNNNIDKYLPYIFTDRLGRTYVCWIEIEKNEISLCFANKNFTEVYSKIDVTNKLNGLSLFCDSEHVYVASYLENKCYYDLCCKRHVNLSLKFRIDKLFGEGYKMNTNVRLILDIKRELECQLNNLRNNMQLDADKYAESMDNLIQENEKIKEEKKQNELEMTDMGYIVKSVLHENDELRQELEKLKAFMKEKMVYMMQEKSQEVNKNSVQQSHKMKPELIKKSGYQFIKKIFDLMKKEA